MLSTLSKPLAFLILTACCHAGVVQQIREASVTVVTKTGTGSGVVVNTKTGSYVWTAYHVVEEAKEVQVTVEIKKSNTMGSLFAGHKSTVLYRDKTLDLALIKCPVLLKRGVKFGECLDIGEDVYHVGAFGGEAYHGSVSKGIISNVMVPFDPTSMDQTDATIVPGSSGGGIFKTDGTCIGLAASTEQPGQSFYVPYRTMKRFAKSNNCLFALE